MTHIVSPNIRTKKQLRETLQDPTKVMQVHFTDPSIFPGAWSGRADQMELGQTIVCTNHPKRSWFASVTKRHDGLFTVK